MKHLFLVPVYNVAHILPYFFNALHELNPKPDYIVFLENNSTDKTLDVIRFYLQHSDLIDGIKSELITMQFDRDHVQKYGVWDLFAKICQRMWQRARELNPEYVWRVDSDVFIRSPDALKQLADWNVDIVAASILRAFPEGLCVSAKWKLDNKYKHFAMRHVRALVRRINDSELLVGRSVALPKWHSYYSIDKTQSSFLGKKTDYGLDRTPLMVGGGLTMFTRKVLCDKRLKWYPLYQRGAVKGKAISEDYSFCMYAHDAGYDTCLDETVIADHVIYDKLHEIKPWSSDRKGDWQFGSECE